MFAESERIWKKIKKQKQSKNCSCQWGTNVRPGSAKDSVQHLLQVFHGMMPLATLISKKSVVNALHAKYGMSFSWSYGSFGLTHCWTQARQNSFEYPCNSPLASCRWHHEGDAIFCCKSWARYETSLRIGRSEASHWRLIVQYVQMWQHVTSTHRYQEIHH